MAKKPAGRLAEVTGTDVSIDPAEHYDGWANSYDNDLLNEYGYSAHTTAVAAFAGVVADKNAAVIDVGCGTGLVGVELRDRGYSIIDGIDVSKGMLTKAKTTDVYRELIWQDVEKGSAIDDGAYDAVICVGSFGIGHLGPEAMPGLVRMARPGGPVVIFMNAEPYINENYTAHVERMEADGVWAIDRIEDHNYMSTLDRPGKLIIAHRPSSPVES